MPYIIVGLGNPGNEYDETRHNTGYKMLFAFAEAENFPEWEKNKKLKAETCEQKLGKEKVMLVLPETFMNKSGNSVKPLITSVKKAESLIVVHDDLDLPMGKIKISYNRGTGGHQGLESIKRAIKTEGFVRVRVGISPATAKGEAKKPSGEKAVIDFILGKWKPTEIATLKKVSKRVSEALKVLVTEGREKAMGEFNGN